MTRREELEAGLEELQSELDELNEEIAHASNVLDTLDEKYWKTFYDYEDLEAQLAALPSEDDDADED